MPHMPLGAHGVAISTIFNVDFFKQIQQIQIQTDTDTPNCKVSRIQILTDTCRITSIQIQILKKGLYPYPYP